MQTFVFPVTDPIRQTIGRKAQHVYRAIGRIPFAQKPVRPVFVVGTGRCGSRIVRSLIASHPDFVSYQSEANDLWHPHSYNYHRRTIETPSMLFDPQELKPMGRWLEFAYERLCADPRDVLREISVSLCAYDDETPGLVEIRL